MTLHIDAEEVIRVPAVGDNNADNTYNTPLVTSNRDGTVLERLEWVIDALVAHAVALANWVLSFLILTETGATVTTDGTEQTLYVNNSPTGVFSPKIVQIDFTNQTAAETVVIKEYYRIKSGGVFVLIDEVTFVGVQDPLLKNIRLEENRFGVRVTIEKTAGGNKDYDYEAVYAI